jgi:Lipid II flippase MurJ
LIGPSGCKSRLSGDRQGDRAAREPEADRPAVQPDAVAVYLRNETSYSVFLNLLRNPAGAKIALGQHVKKMSINKLIARDSVKASTASFFMQGAAFVVAIIVARLFGANLQTDAYFLALSIPTIFNAAHLGALKAVFIPVFTRYINENPAEEKKCWAPCIFHSCCFPRRALS